LRSGFFFSYENQLAASPLVDEHRLTGRIIHLERSQMMLAQSTGLPVTGSRR
jgi:hypothetical protein